MATWDFTDINTQVCISVINTPGEASHKFYIEIQKDPWTYFGKLF